MFKVNGLSVEATKKRYSDMVEQYIKLNAAIDLMRVGVEIYAERYPNDQAIAYGTLMSMKYMIELLEQKMAEVKKYRERSGFDPLPVDFPTATGQLIKEHYGTLDDNNDPI